MGDDFFAIRLGYGHLCHFTDVGSRKPVFRGLTVGFGLSELPKGCLLGIPQMHKYGPVYSCNTN